MQYLAQVVRYIHLNPVQITVVKQPEEYRWSSHIKYLQTKRSTAVAQYRGGTCANGWEKGLL